MFRLARPLAALTIVLAASSAFAQEDGPDASTANQAAAPQPPAPEDELFTNSLNDVLVMTPGQIQRYQQMLDQNMRAMSQPAVPVEAQPARSIEVTLKPGEQTPELKLAGGNATPVTFSDVTGQPWPVVTLVVGNPSLFTAQNAGEAGKSNIIIISPLQAYGESNLIVTLKDHPVPVTLKLQNGQTKIDSRVDVKVRARGPNAMFDLADSNTLPPTGDSTMLAFLDGLAPDGAVKLEVSTPLVEAWRYRDLLYVRTALDLRSPAYIGKSTSVSGTHVYSMTDIPAILVSRNGTPTIVNIGQ